MARFETLHLSKAPSVVAPDASEVKVLLALAGGGMAQFELRPDQISKAVTHRTVEEIWFFLSGCGQMWRKQAEEASIVDLHPGLCLTIPQGTEFQFRSLGDEPLRAVAVTMPPWPGEDEAIIVEGEWLPTVA